MLRTSSLASLFVSNALIPCLHPLSIQRALNASHLNAARALSAASPVKNRRFKKELSWVSSKAKKKDPPPPSSTKQEAALTIDSSNWYPEYGRLSQCNLQQGAYRVEHLVVSEGGVVGDYISKALHLPSMYVADLIQFGAVHYALVCPKPPPTATPEQFRIYKEVTNPSVLKKRSSIKGKTVREAQKTFRITNFNEFVETGTYLRVHVHPKRFPRCYEVDWKSRIIAITDAYVVLHKPAATSVGGTTDNIEECCVTFASRALGLETPLLTTHQIDNCTEGCVVLARTKKFCSVFHRMIREKQVKKLYLALAAAPVPIGIISHYMRPVNIAPRLVSTDSIDGWHLCQLEVLECKEVPWPNDSIEKIYNIDDCGWLSKRSAFECRINLLTGKTHQIRAQLAAIGAPLVGDSMYMPAAVAQMKNPVVNPFGSGESKYTSEEGSSLAETEEGNNKTEAAIEEWISCHGKEPNGAIGLHASHISWDNGNCSYEATTPWWRLENN